MEITRDLHNRGVTHIAIQKYIPHFEDNEHGTTPQARNQFFDDDNLRKTINEMFTSVVWRE